MAPIKFEESMKDKLEKRAIAPSTESWSKLAKRLDDDGKKGKTPLFWWLGIAASLLILVVISVTIFGESKIQKTLPIVVETDTENNESINNEAVTLKEASSKIADIDEETINKTEETQSKAKILNTTISNTKTQNIAQIEKDPKSPSTKVSSNDEERLVLPKESTILQSQLDLEAVATIIDKTKTTAISPSDREIDSLLKAANKALLKNEIFKENTKTVDANSLLQDVEEELDQSFRSKVLDALVSGYETVKTAVANRNN